MSFEHRYELSRKKFTVVSDGQDLLLPVDSDTATYLGLVEGSTVHAELVDGELTVFGSTGKQIKFSINDR